MNKKLISSSMLTIMSVLATSNIVEANELTIDELYKNAHSATLKALETKNQGDINKAREAVRDLPKNIEWAIGEFSKKLDSVQTPILKKIVDSINATNSDGGLNQANINVIYNCIPNELPDKFKLSYCTARDNVQMKFNKLVIEQVKKAEGSNLEEDIKQAQALVDELKTAVAKSVQNLANNVLQVRLNILNGDDVKELIETAKDKTDLEVFDDLINIGFNRVNESFISDYKTGIENLANEPEDKKTFEHIQLIIDNVNKKELDFKFKKEVDNDLIVPNHFTLDEFKKEVEKFYPQNNNKEVIIKKCNEKISIANFNNSIYKEMTKEALMNLSKYSNFDYSIVNEHILDELTVYNIDNNKNGGCKEVSEVKEFIDINTKKIISDKIYEVKEMLEHESIENEILKSFKEVELASQKEKEAVNRFDVNIVKKDKFERYNISIKSADLADLANGGANIVDTVPELTKIIKDINDKK